MDPGHTGAHQLPSSSPLLQPPANSSSRGINNSSNSSFHDESRHSIGITTATAAGDGSSDGPAAPYAELNTGLRSFILLHEAKAAADHAAAATAAAAAAAVSVTTSLTLQLSPTVSPASVRAAAAAAAASSSPLSLPAVQSPGGRATAISGGGASVSSPPAVSLNYGQQQPLGRGSLIPSSSAAAAAAAALASSSSAVLPRSPSTRGPTAATNSNGNKRGGYTGPLQAQQQQHRFAGRTTPAVIFYSRPSFLTDRNITNMIGAGGGVGSMSVYGAPTSKEVYESEASARAAAAARSTTSTVPTAVAPQQRVVPPLLDLVPPYRFGRVEDGVYRGAYPVLRNFPFMASLGLKTILQLTPEEPTYDLRTFAAAHGIRVIHVQAERFKGESQLPPSDITTALQAIIDASCHPIYVHCLDGRQVVGLVAMALRKLMAWDMASNHLEFRRYSKTTEDEVAFVGDYVGPVAVPLRVPRWLWGGHWASDTAGTPRLKLQAQIRLKFPTVTQSPPQPPQRQQQQQSSSPQQLLHAGNTTANANASGGGRTNESSEGSPSGRASPQVGQLFPAVTYGGGGGGGSSSGTATPSRVQIPVPGLSLGSINNYGTSVGGSGSFLGLESPPPPGPRSSMGSHAGTPRAAAGNATTAAAAATAVALSRQPSSNTSMGATVHVPATRQQQQQQPVYINLHDIAPMKFFVDPAATGGTAHHHHQHQQQRGQGGGVGSSTRGSNSSLTAATPAGPGGGGATVTATATRSAPTAAADAGTLSAGSGASAASTAGGAGASAAAPLQGSATNDHSSGGGGGLLDGSPPPTSAATLLSTQRWGTTTATAAKSNNTTAGSILGGGAGAVTSSTSTGGGGGGVSRRHADSPPLPTAAPHLSPFSAAPPLSQQQQQQQSDYVDSVSDALSGSGNIHSRKSAAAVDGGGDGGGGDTGGGSRKVKRRYSL